MGGFGRFLKTFTKAAAPVNLARNIIGGNKALLKGNFRGALKGWAGGIPGTPAAMKLQMMREARNQQQGFAAPPGGPLGAPGEMPPVPGQMPGAPPPAAPPPGPPSGAPNQTLQASLGGAIEDLMARKNAFGPGAPPA